MTKNPEQKKKKPKEPVRITRFMRAWFHNKLTKRNRPKIPGYTREDL